MQVFSMKKNACINNSILSYSIRQYTGQTCLLYQQQQGQKQQQQFI